MSEYGFDEVSSTQLRRILRRYRQEILLLRRMPLPEFRDGMTEAEWEEIAADELASRTEKIERLKDKARAGVKDFLRRVRLPNLQLTVLSGNRATFPRIMAECTACHNTVDFLTAVEFEGGKLGLRCPSCGAERWES